MLMRRRLYFMLPDSNSAREMLDEMLLARRHPEAVSGGFEPTIPAFP